MHLSVTLGDSTAKTLRGWHFRGWGINNIDRRDMKGGTMKDAEREKNV